MVLYRGARGIDAICVTDLVQGREVRGNRKHKLHKLLLQDHRHQAWTSIATMAVAIAIAIPGGRRGACTTQVTTAVQPQEALLVPGPIKEATDQGVHEMVKSNLRDVGKGWTRTILILRILLKLENHLKQLTMAMLYMQRLFLLPTMIPTTLDKWIEDPCLLAYISGSNSVFMTSLREIFSKILGIP